MRYHFWCCGILTKIPRKPFCDQWHIFNSFVSKCAVAFHTTYGKNKAHEFDNEGFIPVDSLCGVVGLPSWFTKCLIVITVNIWSVVYINAICIYLSETCACTIIKYARVRNVCHVTSTQPLISWWSGDVNANLKPHIERPYRNPLEVNWLSESVWLLSISHHPNSHNFPDLAWNISSLSMTSSVVIFSIPSNYGIME